MQLGVEPVKSWMKLIRTITLLGQLGFTLITPPVAMALLGWWLQSRFGLGTWVMLVCLVIGLMTAAASAVTFYRRVMARVRGRAQAEEPAEKPVVFYQHE